MHLSEVRPSELYIAINMVPILCQSRLFLSMKAPSIVELLFVERHGHCQGNVQSEILSLSEGDGKEMNIQLVFIPNFPFSYSLLPALSLNGVIFAKVVEGSFTALRFQEFISHLLDHMQPFPLPHSVIVMDNARIHKRPEILEMIYDRYRK